MARDCIYYGERGECKANKNERSTDETVFCCDVPFYLDARIYCKNEKKGKDKDELQRLRV